MREKKHIPQGGESIPDCPHCKTMLRSLADELACLEDNCEVMCCDVCELVMIYDEKNHRLRGERSYDNFHGITQAAIERSKYTSKW
jgi:hypothetical protein